MNTAHNFSVHQSPFDLLTTNDDVTFIPRELKIMLCVDDPRNDPFFITGMTEYEDSTYIELACATAEITEVDTTFLTYISRAFKHAFLEDANIVADATGFRLTSSSLRGRIALSFGKTISLSPKEGVIVMMATLTSEYAEGIMTFGFDPTLNEKKSAMFDFAKTGIIPRGTDAFVVLDIAGPSVKAMSKAKGSEQSKTRILERIKRYARYRHFCTIDAVTLMQMLTGTPEITTGYARAVSCPLNMSKKIRFDKTHGQCIYFITISHMSGLYLRTADKERKDQEEILAASNADAL